MENLNACPVCGSTKFEKFLDCIDYTVSKKAFSIVSCSSCNLHFTNPRPGAAEIGPYYESKDYISHSNSKTGLINRVYQTVRSYSLKKKVELINSLASKGALLDIGCGTGEFLFAAKNNGWNVKGVEPSPAARKMAIDNYKLDIVGEESINTLNPASFEIITMWHVLEHVHELKKRIGELHKLLKSGGVAVIAVPNMNSYDAKHYKEHWAAYDVPRHLYHFTAPVIKKAFEQEGFRFDRSLPMKFDSFYVSMLSEKYLRGKNGLLQAFLTGMKSNNAAGNNPEKYSSVIYVFKKA
ncbi:MAG: class I SAM-dependent methyltransferase [Bacteroidetes bacterium]|nr:class I SAM-dependent methyltransferase [Bacteroidota bacterium]